MKRKILESMERNYDNDNAEIGRQVAEGYTSGIIDGEDGYRISWALSVDKFEY